MNYKKITAGALAMLMLAAFTGCGKDKPSEVSGDAPVVSNISDTEQSDGSSEKSENSDERDAEKNEDKADTTKADDISDKEKTTTKAAGNTSHIKNPNANKPSGSGNSSDNNSGSNGNSQQKPQSTKATEKPHTPTVTTVITEPEKTFDAEITFNGNASVKGVNAKADGSVVRITAGGDYIVRGNSSNGQIYVSTVTEEKVEITLDNVDISCSSGPAIFINEAKRCVLKLADGSVNYLSDGGNDKINDGVIFSNDTLRIKGGGYLEINSGNAHGIASDDDVIIESGEYAINSIKSGIFAHDNITVNGGELTIFGGTNGIKSKGTVNINGGTAWVCGGTKEEKSSIYAAAGLYYTDGYVYAAGNMVTPPSETPNPYIVVNWKNGVSAGETVGFVLGGTEFAVLTPKNPYKCVMMLAPDILIGDGFTPYLNGSGQGDFTVSEGQNLFVIE